MRGRGGKSRYIGESRGSPGASAALRTRAPLRACLSPGRGMCGRGSAWEMLRTKIKSLPEARGARGGQRGGGSADDKWLGESPSAAGGAAARSPAAGPAGGAGEGGEGTERVILAARFPPLFFFPLFLPPPPRLPFLSTPLRLHKLLEINITGARGREKKLNKRAKSQTV